MTTNIFIINNIMEIFQMLKTYFDYKISLAQSANGLLALDVALVLLAEGLLSLSFVKNGLIWPFIFPTLSFLVMLTCIPNFTDGDIISDYSLPFAKSDLNLVAAVDLDDSENTENSRWTLGE